MRRSAGDISISTKRVGNARFAGLPLRGRSQNAAGIYARRRGGLALAQDGRVVANRRGCTVPASSFPSLLAPHTAPKPAHEVPGTPAQRLGDTRRAPTAPAASQRWRGFHPALACLLPASLQMQAIKAAQCRQGGPEGGGQRWAACFFFDVSETLYWL